MVSFYCNLIVKLIRFLFHCDANNTDVYCHYSSHRFGIIKNISLQPICEGETPQHRNNEHLYCLEHKTDDVISVNFN